MDPAKSNFSMRVASLAFYKIKQLGHVFLFVFQNPMIAAAIPICLWANWKKEKIICTHTPCITFGMFQKDSAATLADEWIRKTSCYPTTMTAAAMMKKQQKIILYEFGRSFVVFYILLYWCVFFCLVLTVSVVSSACSLRLNAKKLSLVLQNAICTSRIQNIQTLNDGTTL